MRHISNNYAVCFFIVTFALPNIALSGTSEKIIFLHHSTGSGVYNGGGVEAWFTNYNQTNGCRSIIRDNFPCSPTKNKIFSQLK